MDVETRLYRSAGRFDDATPAYSFVPPCDVAFDCVSLFRHVVVVPANSATWLVTHTRLSFVLLRR